MRRRGADFIVKWSAERQYFGGLSERSMWRILVFLTVTVSLCPVQLLQGLPSPQVTRSLCDVSDCLGEISVWRKVNSNPSALLQPAESAVSRGERESRSLTFINLMPSCSLHALMAVIHLQILHWSLVGVTSLLKGPWTCSVKRSCYILLLDARCVADCCELLYKWV